MFGPPVVIIKVGDGIEQDRQDMGKEEIGNEDHAEIPLLFTLCIYTHNILNSIDLWKDKWNFEDKSQPAEVNEVILDQDVQEKEHQIQQVQFETIF